MMYCQSPKKWLALSKSSAQVLLLRKNVTQHGVSLWSVWFTGPARASSQLLAYSGPIYCVGADQK